MTHDVTDKLYALLVASLPAWRLAGDVQRQADEAVIIAVGGRTIRITSAPPDLPFRWMVDTGDRTRGAASVVGVLRAVRSVLDPAYRPVRLRIAPAPATPS